MKNLTVFSILAAFFLFSSNAQAQPPDARVLSVTQGVVYNLAGKSESLAVKMDVPIQAELKSDATGKAQLIFPDDSTLTIAPETVITLSDYSDIEDEENILLDLAAGTARIITGESNRKNPQAFTVNTPQASIGIRGTLVTIQVSGDLTRVYLTETSGQGVSVRNLHTGKVMELKKPGRIINVGPNYMEERKAQKEEAASFNTALRGKSRRAIQAVTAQVELERAPVANLAPEGTLPPVGLADPVQVAALTTDDRLAQGTLVVESTPIVPDVPVTPSIPATTEPILPEQPVDNYMITNFSDIAGLSFSGTGEFDLYAMNQLGKSGTGTLKMQFPMNPDLSENSQFTVTMSDFTFPSVALNSGEFRQYSQSFSPPYSYVAMTVKLNGEFSASMADRDENDKKSLHMEGKLNSLTSGTISEFNASNSSGYLYPRITILTKAMTINRAD